MYHAEKPIVVLSLDYELRWGVHDRLGDDWSTYREELENENACVENSLALLEDRNLHATWATVGAIGCENWDEYFSLAPSPPEYRDSRLRIKQTYAKNDPDGRLHFSPETVKKILRTPHQDLGTHTFSHLFLCEPGVTAADATRDHLSVKTLWERRFGADPVSLVFPRNQIAFKDALLACGVKIYRGNQMAWYFNCNDASTNTRLPRLLRLLDSVNPFVSHAVRLERGMTRSSAFVRFNLPEPIWKLHMHKIEHSLKTKRPGLVNHFWWHPHNLGKDLPRKLSRLAQVLDLIGEFTSSNKVLSMNMRELIEHGVCGIAHSSTQDRGRPAPASWTTVVPCEEPKP